MEFFVLCLLVSVYGFRFLLNAQKSKRQTENAKRRIVDVQIRCLIIILTF